MSEIESVINDLKIMANPTDEEMECLPEISGFEAKIILKEIERLNKTNNEIFKANETLAEEIKRLNTLIDKYDKELTHKTEQYEYLRHYHNLSPMKQYPIERDVFCEIFGKIDEEFYSEIIDITTESFKVWWYHDEFYILHFESGTIINWYKHLGRCNTCSKDLSIEEYRKLANDLYNELKEKLKK